MHMAGGAQARSPKSIKRLSQLLRLLPGLYLARRCLLAGRRRRSLCLPELMPGRLRARKRQRRRVWLGRGPRRVPPRPARDSTTQLDELRACSSSSLASRASILDCSCMRMPSTVSSTVPASCAEASCAACSSLRASLPALALTCSACVLQAGNRRVPREGGARARVHGAGAVGVTTGGCPCVSACASARACRHPAYKCTGRFKRPEARLIHWRCTPAGVANCGRRRGRTPAADTSPTVSSAVSQRSTQRRQHARPETRAP